jgi:hypothetical protein
MESEFLTTTSIVIDNVYLAMRLLYSYFQKGSGILKAGFAAVNKPSCVIPSL